MLAEGSKQFTLLDSKTGAQQRLPWPSSLGLNGQPAVDPESRFVALQFAVPTWNTLIRPRGWKGGPLQVLDVWILDTKTGKFTQLPGMPAFVSIKRTDLAWTDDGRLVLLGHSNGDDVVAVWRHGQRRLAVNTLRLPDRSDSGSDSFAPIG